MPPSDATDEPERKRVRFDGQRSSTSSGSSAGQRFKRAALSARDTVQLRFVHTDEDVHQLGASANHPSSLTARPSFLHQIIPDEMVYGYRRAVIAVYIHLRSLTHWIDSDLDHRTDRSPPLPKSAKRALSATGAHSSPDRFSPTDVKALITPFVKAGLVDSHIKFLSAVQSPFQMPLSNRIATYSVGSKSFAVYKEKLFESDQNGIFIKRTAFHDFHRRMAFFMFVSIDGASFIDDEDPRWEIFVTAKLDNDEPSTFIGYATTYPFSAMTRTKSESNGTKAGESAGSKPRFNISFVDRIRISQVAIVPIFQRQGHGARLLEAIYQDALSRRALEVTVEDPSKAFRVVRDVTDLQRAYQSEVLPSNRPLPYGEETTAIQALRTKLLLTLTQARRCLEVHQLRFVDRENEDSYKKYRLWVKRRLMNENYEELMQFEAQLRKEKLGQLYEDYEGEYATAVRRIDVLGQTTDGAKRDGHRIQSEKS